MLRRGAEHEAREPRIDLADLAAFLVAATDGLVIQYEVTHDEQACLRELEQVIRAGALLAGVTPEEGPAKGPRGAAPRGEQAALTNGQREPGGAAP